MLPPFADAAVLHRPCAITNLLANRHLGIVRQLHVLSTPSGIFSGDQNHLRTVLLIRQCADLRLVFLGVNRTGQHQREQ